MSFDVQHSTMSPVLPFEIIALIIDIVGENKDTNLLKELTLVSHSFLRICSKHLFATVELKEASVEWKEASPKNGFLKLLKSRPDVVNYIRKLTYKVSYNSLDNEDHLLSPILLRLTIPRLNCLTIDASGTNWNALDSSLISAFLHLIHLPTINHIVLSNMEKFPLSSLTPSVNLYRLDISRLRRLYSVQVDDDDSAENVVLSEMIPKIREFRTSDSTLLTTKMLHSKRQDGRPAFNFADLRRLTMNLIRPEDERNFRYLLQNAKLLEELHLYLPDTRDQNLLPVARTLKVLRLTVSLDSVGLWLYENLEAMAGHNMLEDLSFEFHVVGYYGRLGEAIGSMLQKVETVLVNPGWSALRQVSFEVIITNWGVLWKDHAHVLETLQSLPDKYLSHLPKLESVAFNFSIT